MRPAQFSQILPTPPLGREPRSKLLIRPRIVTPADRTVANHEHRLLHSSRYAGCMFDSDEELPAAGAVQLAGLIEQNYAELKAAECRMLQLACALGGCALSGLGQR
jgi:hypothetical protein